MIGAKIKELADKANKSREEMSVLLGISVPTLHRIYNSDDVDTKILKKLCQNFNVSMSFFLNDNEKIDTPILEKEIEKKDTFSNSVVEELRATIEKLEQDKVFLQEMVRQQMALIQSQMAKINEKLDGFAQSGLDDGVVKYKEIGDSHKAPLLLFAA